MGFMKLTIQFILQKLVSFLIKVLIFCGKNVYKLLIWSLKSVVSVKSLKNSRFFVKFSENWKSAFLFPNSAKFDHFPYRVKIEALD